ncbi:hypothetical protein RKD20_008910 [Streptomyces sp. SLBN-8D4]|jgi:hypothetical protein
MANDGPGVTAACFWIIKVLITGLGERASHLLERTLGPVPAAELGGLALAAALTVQFTLGAGRLETPLDHRWGSHALPVLLTGGNRNDVTQLLPLLDAIPPVRGRVGRPRRTSAGAGGLAEAPAPIRVPRIGPGPPGLRLAREPRLPARTRRAAHIPGAGLQAAVPSNAGNAGYCMVDAVTA